MTDPDLLGRVRRHLARRGEWWWVPLVYALAVAWIYRDLWHQHGVATGLGWDTIDTHGPDLDFFSRELAEGRFSRWNPYDKGGYPIFCDPVFDRYYPFNWPFAAWGALFGSSWWLVQIKVMAHHVAAGSMLHLFLRSRGLPRLAAFIGGIGLVACAPLLTHKASNILWPLVWMPLVWAAIDFVLAQPSWRRGAALGGALLLCMTAGSPPGLFYTALGVLPYALLRLATTLRDPQRRTRAELGKLAVAGGVAIGIAVLVAGVTVIPTGELVALGSRDRFAPPGRAFALALSLPLPAAMRGVFVRGAGLFELYMGATVVMLALVAFVARPRFDRGASIAFAITAVFGVLLAAGATGTVLPFLVDHVPGFGMLRVPGRYKLLAAWSLCAAAGYGVAALGDRERRARVLAVVGMAVVIAVACVLVWGHPDSANARPAWWSMAVTVVVAGLISASVLTPSRFATACTGALAVCALVDAPLFTFVPPVAPPAAEPRQTHAHDAAVVAKLEGVRDRWRVYDEFVLGERAGARLRIRDFRGYPALDPISLRRYVDVLDFAKKDPAIITDFNVRYVLDRPHFRYGNSTSFVTLPNPAFEARGDALYEAKHPAPLVQWVGAVKVVPQGRVLETMRATQEPDGLRRVAVVEPPDALLIPRLLELHHAAAVPPMPGQGTLTRYEPNEITFTVDAPGDGLVILNEILFPGWEVDVDGQPATPVRANYLLRAVRVEAGHHTITWHFEPHHWRALVGGYVIALLTLLAAALVPRRRSARA